MTKQSGAHCDTVSNIMESKYTCFKRDAEPMARIDSTLGATAHTRYTFGAIGTLI